MINKVGLLPTVEIEPKSTEKKVEEVQNKELLSSVKNKESSEKPLTEATVKPALSSYKALWVIDDKNNVFIRIEDEKGNVIRQIPPEELINLKERMSEMLKNMFKIEV